MSEAGKRLLGAAKEMRTMTSDSKATTDLKGDRFDTVAADFLAEYIGTAPEPHELANLQEALAAVFRQQAALVEALERAERVLSYPVSTEIKPCGFGVRTDDDSVGHAVEVIRGGLSAAKGEGQ